MRLHLSSCPICQSDEIHPYMTTKAQMHNSDEEFNFDQCKQCNLVFLNPRPEPEKLSQYYSDYYLPYKGSAAWGKYADQVERSQQKLDRKRVRLVAQYHDIQADTEILDVGCGKPTFLKSLTTRYGCRGTGIDFSNIGWISETEQFDGIDLMVGELEDYAEKLNPDIISMWHYLEHDYDPEKTLTRVQEIAKPGATLIIEVPDFMSESRKKFGKKWAGWHTPRHTMLFSPANLRMLLSNTGWKVEGLFQYGTLNPYNLYWMSRMEQKGIEWDKNMETEFVNYVIGLIRFLPKLWTHKRRALGIMHAVAKKAY